LFDKMIPDYTLKEIRDAVNKAWILGAERFKKEIEEKTDVPLLPLKRGGDRKSQRFRASNGIKFI